MNALNPVMRIRDQIGDAILTHESKVSKKRLKKRVEELLVEVGLKPSVAEMYPNELSGGMKQRVAIAMAVAHDMAVQAEISEKLAVMYAGKIAELGDTKVIYREPLHPYVKALISAIPSIEKKKELISLSGLPPDLRNPPPGCLFHPRCPMLMQNKCDVEEPKPIEVNGRIVACHLYG